MTMAETVGMEMKVKTDRRKEKGEWKDRRNGKR